MKPARLVSAFVLILCATAHATVVNVNARVSGAQPGPFVNGSYSFWHDPFNTVPLSLAAGAYDFQIVDPATDSSALYTAWSYNSPFITNYLVFLSTDPTHELFDGAVSDSVLRFSAQAAFDATVAAGKEKTTFSFADPVTLLFAIPDNIVGDNQAGISISVLPASPTAAPEPAAYILLVLGLLGMAMIAVMLRHELAT
jgi:hypothetical protein